jgi:hypothetical protein
VVLCLVAVLVAACSGGDGSDEGRSSTTTQAADAAPVVPAGGRVLAEVEGVGEVRAGFADFGAGGPKVRAAKAGPVPKVEGLLAAGPGLTAKVGKPFTGALQVRLDVPKPPTDAAVPGAVYRGADGRVSFEPALWDPATSQVVVWATSFSDRWGAWFDPLNWAEGVVKAGQGAFDFVADFLTGRTDPPACRKDPPAPSWASVATSELSSLHVCPQANPAKDGTERFELFLTSNRRTAQLVTIPSPTVKKDYVWAENSPDSYQRLLTSLAGVDPGSNTTLLGTYSMSLGFRRPKQSLNVEVLAGQTWPIIIVNPLLALLGNLPLEGAIGVTAAAAKCHAEASGIDLTRLDPIPDDTRPDVKFLEAMVRCALEVLQQPDLAFGVVRETAAAAGVRDSAGLAKVKTALRALESTVDRIVPALAQFAGSALTNAWDGVFDNLADGRITITMVPPTPPFDPEAAAARWLRFDVQCRGQTTGIDEAACDRRDALTDRIWREARSAFFRAWTQGDLATGERLSTDAVRTDPGFSTAKLFDLRPTEKQLDCRDPQTEGFACYVSVTRAAGQKFDVYLTFDMQLGYMLLKSWRPDV